MQDAAGLAVADNGERPAETLSRGGECLWRPMDAGHHVPSDRATGAALVCSAFTVATGTTLHPAVLERFDHRSGDAQEDEQEGEPGE